MRRVGGGLRGQWVQLCTCNPNKLWESCSIFNLCLFPIQPYPIALSLYETVEQVLSCGSLKGQHYGKSLLNKLTGKFWSAGVFWIVFYIFIFSSERLLSGPGHTLLPEGNIQEENNGLRRLLMNLSTDQLVNRVGGDVGRRYSLRVLRRYFKLLRSPAIDSASLYSVRGQYATTLFLLGSLPP
jgi:hypothetical protein